MAFRMSTRQSVGIAALSAVLAFGINAAAHLILLIRHSPLVAEHRGTLQFKSAWTGDLILLPIMNVAATRLLRRIGGSPGRAEFAGSLAAAGTITAGMHVIQARGGLVNWSMPEPWHWNALGYYHLLFMWGQLTLLALALIRAARNRSRLDRDGGVEAAVVTVGLLLMSLLIKLDYSPEHAS